MKANTKKFIKGAGSIIDLCPSVRLDNFPTQKRSVNEQIEKVWCSVGAAFIRALDDFNKKEINPNKKMK